MACLGTINIILKDISANVSDQSGNVIALTGLAAEMAYDGTVRAYLAQTKDVLTTATEAIGGDNSALIVTAFTVADVADTRDYCTCNGLCY